MSLRPDEPGEHWYFAYGSNLDPETFCGRRRIQPLDTRTALITDYRLSFNLPVGTSNRGVANVLPEPGGRVWGVIYRISTHDAGRLDRSEGVGRDFYRRIIVVARTADGPEIEAFTYSSARGRRGRLPSPRYLGLLVNGARHHRLPQGWIDHLLSWPLAQDERTRHQGSLFGL